MSKQPSRSKLSLDTVCRLIVMYRLYPEYSQEFLAEMHGITGDMVGNLLKRRTWKDLPWL